MSKKIPFPVKYVTRKQLKRKHVCLSQYPNAGPRPNVTGMRERFWGNDAPLLKHGVYVYKVPIKVYHKF